MVREIKREGYTVCLSEPEVYVDNQAGAGVGI